MFDLRRSFVCEVQSGVDAVHGVEALGSTKRKSTLANHVLHLKGQSVLNRITCRRRITDNENEKGVFDIPMCKKMQSRFHLNQHFSN